MKLTYKAKVKGPHIEVSRPSMNRVETTNCLQQSTFNLAGGTGFLDSRPCSQIKDFICMAFPMYPHEAEKFQNESTYPALLALENHETVSLTNITVLYPINNINIIDKNIFFVIFIKLSITKIALVRMVNSMESNTRWKVQ